MVHDHEMARESWRQPFYSAIFAGAGSCHRIDSMSGTLFVSLTNRLNNKKWEADGREGREGYSFFPISIRSMGGTAISISVVAWISYSMVVAYRPLGSVSFVA